MSLLSEYLILERAALLHDFARSNLSRPLSVDRQGAWTEKLQTRCCRHPVRNFRLHAHVNGDVRAYARNCDRSVLKQNRMRKFRSDLS